MTINRRNFVTTAGAACVAGAVTRSLASPAVSSPEKGYADWAQVRAQFELAARYLHLSQFFLVSHPRPVREAIERYRRLIDSNPVAAVEHGIGLDVLVGQAAQEEPFTVRIPRAVADYAGGQPEEIALTDSTTQGLALIYNGLTLRPGEEILTTTHDHYSHHESIRLAAERSGARTRRFDLYDEPAEASIEQMQERLRRAIGPNTRVVGLTWVHSGTGVKIPVRMLAKVVSDANQHRSERERILLVLDAVHGFGNQDEPLARLGCDFIASGTHKWIFAPRGTGIIWAPAKNWALLRPTIPSFYSEDMIESWQTGQPPRATPKASWYCPGGFKAYEHTWAMIEAFEFHRALGRKRVAERIAALNTLCKEGLSGIRSVKVHTPRDPGLSAGITCFEVQGQTAEQTVRKLLERKVIASSMPYKVSYARLAPSLVNDEQDVEAAVRAVHAIA